MSRKCGIYKSVVLATKCLTFLFGIIYYNINGYTLSVLLSLLLYMHIQVSYTSCVATVCWNCLLM